MSVLKRFLLVAFPLVAAPALILAAPGEIKLATLAPANTSWHKALLDMGNTWSKDTGGRVTLTVYAGGTQGVLCARERARHAVLVGHAALGDVDPGACTGQLRSS